jgi:ATP-dependent exoDNAse (exonuclease V) alpha subunit
VHKSQGLTLQKAVVDLGDKEFTAGLSFVAVSRVRALGDIVFKPFNFERLLRIKDCKRLRERKDEEERLVAMIPRN